MLREREAELLIGHKYLKVWDQKRTFDCQVFEIGDIFQNLSEKKKLCDTLV